MAPTYILRCPACGDEFTAHRSDAVACSGRCRQRLFVARRRAALDRDAALMARADALLRRIAADEDPQD